MPTTSHKDKCIPVHLISQWPLVTQKCDIKVYKSFEEWVFVSYEKAWLSRFNILLALIWYKSITYSLGYYMKLSQIINWFLVKLKRKKKRKMEKKKRRKKRKSKLTVMPSLRLRKKVKLSESKKNWFRSKCRISKRWLKPRKKKPWTELSLKPKRRSMSSILMWRMTSRLMIFEGPILIS